MAAAAFIPELSQLLLAVGGVAVAIGIVYLVVSYGLLKGKGWAWSVTLIVSYIQIVTRNCGWKLLLDRNPDNQYSNNILLV